MLSGKMLLALGCVVTLAVMAGIVGAVVILGGAGALMQLASRPGVGAATPTPAYTQPMKPIPGRIAVSIFDGVNMAGEQSDAEFIEAASTNQDAGKVRQLVTDGKAFFLPNGTEVQIIQSEGHWSRVQVMNGQQRNRVGWVPTNVVTT
jgi:hypothetical protein